MSDEATMSDKRSIPREMTQANNDIIELKAADKAEEDAREELEKRVAKLEFKMWVIAGVSSGAWAVFLIFFSKYVESMP